MKLIYKCEYCGQEFYDSKPCFIHECSHIENENEQLLKIILREGEEPCDYCENSYYVYGCEKECGCKLPCDYRYNQFVSVEPLHNKAHNGGI